jgi:hypothetical protein
LGYVEEDLVSTDFVGDSRYFKFLIIVSTVDNFLVICVGYTGLTLSFMIKDVKENDRI